VRRGKAQPEDCRERIAERDFTNIGREPQCAQRDDCNVQPGHWQSVQTFGDRHQAFAHRQAAVA
jgi:hypothetical protein